MAIKITITKTAANANAITHGGIFHADEILASVILSKVLEELTIHRTFKVPDGIGDNVIVYDIGFGKFDHHQKGGNGTRENGVPYAACGLLWKEFGPKLVKDTCNPTLVWSLVDKELIQGVDSIDNGIAAMPKTDLATPMSFSGIISSFNPTWDSTEDSDEAFKRAVDFAATIFENVLSNAIAKAKAQDIVNEAIENSKGDIVILKQYTPWQEFIFSSTNPKAEKALFVVFPSNRGGYNWQCVPDKLYGFGQRKAVPSEWKGLRDAELQKVTGVSTASFCHPAGFIGGAATLEDAIALAKIAISA